MRNWCTHRPSVYSQDILVEQVQKRAAQLNRYETAVHTARRGAAGQYDNWKPQRHESNTPLSRLIPASRARERPRNGDLAGLYDTAGMCSNS